MRTPRFWLMVWGGIGSLIMAYVLIAASLKPPARGTDTTPLLVGEMVDFTPAFPPRPAPEIPFQSGDTMITLQEFRGQVVLVNFWATWCAPCVKELPSLDALQAQLGDQNFKVVAIAADPRGPEVARTFLDKLDISNLDLYADPRLLFAAAIGGANVLPVSILYDGTGTEIGRLTGEAVWDSPEAIRLIRAVIEGREVK
ncbi:MAG: TlpA disulfide reductase family protein [Pseudomonadota bacterium]